MKEYSELNRVEEGLEMAVVSVIEPPVVKLNLTKETKESSIGIEWYATLEGIKIRSIVQDGLAARSSSCGGGLKVGMKLLSINQLDFQQTKIANHVASAIAILEGELNITLAEESKISYCTALKEENKHPTFGINLASVNSHDIVIRSIRESSPFANSNLNVGDTVVMINDVDCSNGAISKAEAESLLMNAPIGSEVSIYVRKEALCSFGGTPNTPIGSEVSIYFRKEALSSFRGWKPPPPGIADGGVWGHVIYNGDRTKLTSLICCIFGGTIQASIFFCCFPFDKRRVYQLNGRIYAPTGQKLFHLDGQEFKTGGTNEETYDSDRMRKGMALASVVWLLFLLFIFSQMEEKKTYY